MGGQRLPLEGPSGLEFPICYKPKHDSYEWQTMQKTVEYDHHDTALRICGNRTDQIVSRNHRCFVERCRGYTFQLAETWECEARVPVLENLQNLLTAIPLPNEGAGGQEPPLLSQVYAKGSGQEKAAGATQGQDGCVCEMRYEVLEAGCVVAKGESGILLATLQGGRGDGADTCCQQVRQDGHEVSRNRTEGENESSVEGRRDLFPQARELQANQVRPLSSGVSTDGAQGRLCDGAPPHCGAGDRPVSVAVGSGASSQPRPTRQLPE